MKGPRTVKAIAEALQCDNPTARAVRDVLKRGRARVTLPPSRGRSRSRVKPSKPVGRANPSSGRASSAQDLFTMFHGWPSTGGRRVQLPDLSHLADLGRATAIGYESDKFDGKKRLYLHEFEGNQRLAVAKEGRRVALVIFGGGTGISADGITG